MLRRDHRPRVLGVPIGRRPQHSMPGAGWAGAGVVAAAATVPLAQRATRALAHGRDMAGQAGRAVDTARSLEGAVSSHSTTVGKFGAVIGEALKLGRSDGDGKPRLAHLIEEHTDIAAPRQVVYNQWTQMEMFPAIVKGVESVDQGEDDRAEWTSKIGPVRRRWEARIIEQRPDELIAWQAEGGPRHQGVVSFHTLDDQLTRVLVQIQYKPSGPLETVGNTLRIQRRRVRRDLRQFKHFVELSGEETGAWRGRIGDAGGDDGGGPDRESAPKSASRSGADGRTRASQSGGSDDGPQQARTEKARSASGSRSARAAESRPSGAGGTGRSRQSAPAARSAPAGKRSSTAKSSARSNGSSGSGRSRAGSTRSGATTGRKGRS